MKVRDIIKLLERDGWYLMAAKGSHRLDVSRCRASERRSPARDVKQRSEAGRVEAMNYVVVYEKSATGWSAYVPDVPGVITTGSTKEETQRLICEAIEFHLGGLREDNLPIPKPATSAEIVTVA